MSAEARGQDLGMGCTLHSERREICGLEHALVRSGRGESYWTDALFRELIQSFHAPDRVRAVRQHLSVSDELARAGFEAVERLFPPAAAQRRYFLPEVEPYRHSSFNPLVSIIVVNLNGERHLPELVRSIRAQSYRHIEVIIVDNASRDASREILQSCGDITLIEQGENTGFCRGNNIGIRRSRGEILFLLNNDTVLDNRCLEYTVKFLAEAPADVIGVFPKILFYHNPLIINCAKTQWHCRHLWRDNSVGMLDMRRRQRPEQVFGGIFAGIFLRRAAFEALGMFDDAFGTYGEDFDVCYRANLAGYKLFLEPASIVYHKYRTSSREETDISFTLYHFLRNYLIVILKNYEARNIPGALAYFREEFWKPWATRAREQNDKPVGKLLRNVLKSLLFLAPHILRERARVKRMRRVCDRDLWVFDNVDRYNIFHYEGRVVLNIINLTAALDGNARYAAGGREYVVFGESARIPAPPFGRPPDVACGR
jgi:GT2 family glycosyltransferase